MHSPVPSLSHSLKCLSAILTKAEAHCTEHKIDPKVLLNARLYPNMWNVIPNVLSACDTAKGAVARLSGAENPSFEDTETTFEELHARIQKTLEFMATVEDAAFEGAEDRTVTMQAGPQEFKFIGSAYLSGFVNPNFYFHISTVYNILRHNGVEIGKRDYLGAIA